MVHRYKVHQVDAVVERWVSDLQVVHKFLYFHLGLVHARHIFETHTFS